MDAQIISDKFRSVFNERPVLVRSPGRINLLGEHTDYNDGFVLPAAIDREIVLAVAPSPSATCKLYAANLDEWFEFDFDDIHKTTKSWPNYFLGVLDQLVRIGGNIQPCNCVFGGDIPVGGGLSSSAAIACGFACALNELFDLGLSRLDLVHIGHQAERSFVGVQCGIMDPFANIFGQKECVLKLDCRSLEYELMPFEFPDVSLLLLDTQIGHDLASSEYNLRRQQCEAGLAEIRKAHSSVSSLRDVSIAMLQEMQSKLDAILFKRCHYVVCEIDRVVQACADLQRTQLNEFGDLMFATHAGLRDEYEVSCPELDYLVDVAQRASGVLGARLMGAGFGGCTINLVLKHSLDNFIQRVESTYRSKFGYELKNYLVKITSGTARIL